jgi:uncharacterized membrane protein
MATTADSSPAPVPLAPRAVEAAAQGPATSAVAPRPRIDSIDLLRGIVMVIMVLDHTRDFAFAGTLHLDPTNLAQTTPAIFFTRWITHYCAPIFVLLAGTGSYLQRLRGKSRPDLARFLVTRGLWLIFLEFTVVDLTIKFSLDTQLLLFAQVIWVIGCSMILLAGAVYLPTAAVAAIGIAIVLFHNTLDVFPTYQWQGPASPNPTFGQALWLLLHAGPFTILPLGHPFPLAVVLYAVLPWFGVIAVGYALGSLYRLDPPRRGRILLGLGTAVTLAFIVVRALNAYGDPGPWSPQRSPLFTALSFVNTAKYPPSLDYLLMTLGPALLALGWFDGLRPSRVTAPLITIGRVPLFFYLLQWPAAHGLALLAGVLAHKPVGYLFWHLARTPAPPDAGFSLGITYLLWILAILLVYPLCAWFAAVKRRSSAWWLSYL